MRHIGGPPAGGNIPTPRDPAEERDRRIFRLSMQTRTQLLRRITTLTRQARKEGRPTMTFEEIAGLREWTTRDLATKVVDMEEAAETAGQEN